MSERELTPEEEAAVRGLLADAASPASMPPDVAARLDDVLAGLVREREAGDTSDSEGGRADEPGAVVPLRRRRWPQVLAAAAAVSLFGYLGANGLLDGSDGDSMEAVTSDNTAHSEGTDDRGAAPDAPALPGPVAGGGEESEPEPQAVGPEVDVRDLSRTAVNSVVPQFTYKGKLDAQMKRDTCGTPRRQGAATSYTLRLPGARRAVVVLDPVGGAAATAYVYPCGQTVLPVATTLVLGLR